MKKILLILLFAVVVHLTACGSDVEYTDENIIEEYTFTDGTYEGTSEGHRGNEAKVTVEILNDEIISVEVEECGCTPNANDGFYANAADEIAEDIVSENRTDVDAVSGASNTSKAINEAVKNALENAIIE